MGKANELDDWLEQQPPMTPEERERIQGPRPKLRLHRNVRETAVGSDETAQTILGRFASEGAAESVVALHDADTGTTGIVIPEAQYLELVTSYIRDHDLSEIGLDGRAVPTDKTFAALGVEQIDPQESWLRIDRTLG